MTIAPDVEAAKLCNAVSYPTAAYVSRRAKKDDDVTIFLRLVMRSEHILLDTLAFLNLAMTGVVY